MTVNFQVTHAGKFFEVKAVNKMIQMLIHHTIQPYITDYQNAIILFP